MSPTFTVFRLVKDEGPALGLHLNVNKNEIWWPNRASEDPFPADGNRVDSEGVKLEILRVSCLFEDRWEQASLQ